MLHVDVHMYRGGTCACAEVKGQLCGVGSPFSLTELSSRLTRLLAEVCYLQAAAGLRMPLFLLILEFLAPCPLHMLAHSIVASSKLIRKRVSSRMAL